MDEGTSGKEEIKGSIAKLNNLKSMIGENRPGKNWDLRILDPEEHFQKSYY